MPTAIEIFKSLPKKNCGKCNFPTCLAFAMQLANQKVKLSDCPYISDEAKAKLGSASAPPIRLVTIGVGSNKIELGEETELYRHEKKFFHPTRYAMVISDLLTAEQIEERSTLIAALHFERVGQVLKADMLGIRNDSKDTERFVRATAMISGLTDLPMVLITDDPVSMRAAVSKIAQRRPLLYAATNKDVGSMAAIAKDHNCPLVVRSGDMNELAQLVETAKNAGAEDLMLDPAPSSLKEVVERNTIIRKNAVKKIFREMGYPLVTNVCGSQRSLLMAMVSTMKYGGVVLMDDIDPAHALPLFVLRQNIYTDPQVPIQVKAGMYPINGPDESSPIVFTTNFSLTYFTVVGDIEKSKVPTWLLVVDTEGLSVLTAYSAGKLTPESVVKAIEENDARSKSKSGLIVIPGMLSRMSGKLQDISGLKVMVGPKESTGIPKFLKGL